MRTVSSMSSELSSGSAAIFWSVLVINSLTASFSPKSRAFKVICNKTRPLVNMVNVSVLEESVIIIVDVMLVTSVSLTSV